MVFAVGSVVQLNSGGPLMTVEELGMGAPTKSVKCCWLGPESKNSANFIVECLRKIDPEAQVVRGVPKIDFLDGA
jgi:uncharacterized protein YodC (DUF2158 family)